jgi:hypothetical protein
MALRGKPCQDHCLYMTDHDHTRRLFLLSSAFVLGGCASTGSGRSNGSSLPDLVWGTRGAHDQEATKTSPDDLLNMPKGVIARSRWAKGKPIPARMDPMRPVKSITVHHDGMSAFSATGWNDSADRLESIRGAHLGRSPEPFGDIGYHFAIDPAGRIWQCRPLTWQGAHVARQNQGNLGIVLMGNYDKQRPNRAQQASLVAFIAAQMKRYRVPVNAVKTHQEMAATLCPGRNLQAFMVSARLGALA